MIFSGPARVTQGFGARPEYYRSFDLAGHEGVDLVPTGADWTVHAIEAGQVVRAHPGRDGAYGIHVVVWNPASRRGWWYCHFSELRAKVGDLGGAGQALGVMGDTGIAQGAHLHLGLRMTNEQGYAGNLDNGFRGFLDGLVVLHGKGESLCST